MATVEGPVVERRSAGLMKLGREGVTDEDTSLVGET